MVSKSIVAMGSMLLLTLAVLSSVAFATYSRESAPISSEEPVEPIGCPPIQLDSSCDAKGAGVSNSYYEAQGTATNECILVKKNCQNGQLSEYASNRAFCEQIAGCTLKYQVEGTNCQVGNEVTCNPPVGFDDPVKTIYACESKGSYNITNYRCDTGPPGEGEYW